MHSKTANDFAFLNSASFIATGGQSSEARNVCLWDTLVPDSQALVKAFQCHAESSSQSLVYAPGRYLLISGSKKGKLCIFDIRQRRLMHEFAAHDGAITSMCIDKAESSLFTGGSDGTIKIFNLSTYEEKNSFFAHVKQRSFLLGGDTAGVCEVYRALGCLWPCKCTQEYVLVKYLYQVVPLYALYSPTRCTLQLRYMDDYLFSCGADGTVRRWG